MERMERPRGWPAVLNGGALDVGLPPQGCEKSGTLESAATKLWVRSPQLEIGSRVSFVAVQSSKIATRSALLDDRIWKLQLAEQSLKLEARSPKLEDQNLRPEARNS